MTSTMVFEVSTGGHLARSAGEERRRSTKGRVQHTTSAQRVTLHGKTGPPQDRYLIAQLAKPAHIDASPCAGVLSSF